MTGCLMWDGRSANAERGPLLSCCWTVALACLAMDLGVIDLWWEFVRLILISPADAWSYLPMHKQNLKLLGPDNDLFLQQFILFVLQGELILAKEYEYRHFLVIHYLHSHPQNRRPKRLCFGTQ